jgi:hypothetical protein
MNPDGETEENQALRDAERELRTAAIAFALSEALESSEKYEAMLARAATEYEKELRKTL